MLEAYSHLLETAKKLVLKTEIKTWNSLGKAVHSAEEKHSKLLELSKEQIAQVKEDLDADLKQVSEYLNEVEIGIEEFIEMDIAILEEILLEKCNQLADPTDLTILRIRMLAAMEQD